MEDEAKIILEQSVILLVYERNRKLKFNVKNCKIIMSSNLLPKSVNLFLDDFETSLCLPILVIMVLCTAQFVFNHIIDIIYMIYQSFKKPTTGETPDKKTTDMIGKLKGLISLYINIINTIINANINITIVHNIIIIIY